MSGLIPMNAEQMRRKAIQNSAERRQREQEYKDKVQNMSKHNVGGLYDVRAILKSKQFKEQKNHYNVEQATASYIFFLNIPLKVIRWSLQ